MKRKEGRDFGARRLTRHGIGAELHGAAIGQGAAGEAMIRAILHLGAAGRTTSYLNQPIEVPSLRPKLAALLGTAEHPQILLRAGRGPALEPSVRRPVSEVLEG